MNRGKERENRLEIEIEKNIKKKELVSINKKSIEKEKNIGGKRGKDVNYEQKEKKEWITRIQERRGKQKKERNKREY